MKRVFSPVCTLALVVFLTACTPTSSPAAESAKGTGKVKDKATTKPTAAPSVKAKTPVAKPASNLPPAQQVVKVWDFQKEEVEKLGWDASGNHSAGGKDAFWVSMDRNYVDVFNNDVAIKANEVKTFRTEFKVIVRGPKSAGVPAGKAKARLYWATSQDTVKGKHPYAESRAINLKQADPKKPDVWTADLSAHKQWTGDIKSVQLRLYAPDGLALGSEEHLKVILSRCELLK